MKIYTVLCFLILSVSPLGTAQAKQSVLAAISGEALCKATKENQESQRAKLRLLRTGSGYRLLEVENEQYKASGPAAQVENKKTGDIAYFLAFGDRGTINARFSVTPAGQVKAKLQIVAFPRKEAQGDPPSDIPPEGWSYEYDCVKTE